jgi:hypothetical protein
MVRVRPFSPSSRTSNLCAYVFEDSEILLCFTTMEQPVCPLDRAPSTYDIDCYRIRHVAFLLSSVCTPPAPIITSLHEDGGWI